MSPTKYRLKVIQFDRQSGLCHWCRRPMFLAPPGVDSTRPDLATREHLVPRSRGGGEGENVVLACKKCNNERIIIEPACHGPIPNDDLGTKPLSYLVS